MKLVDILTQPVDVTNPAARAEQERQLLLVSEARRQAAIARATQMGMPVSGRTKDGGVFSLQDFRGGRPVYYQTNNTNAFISTAANQVRGVAQFPRIDGLGMLVGVWDGGHVMKRHLAFTTLGGRSRVIYGDSAGHEDHPTHVGGTLAGAVFTPTNNIAGDPKAILSTDVEGMVPRAQLLSCDFNSDIAEMTATGAATADFSGVQICISNHSYGAISGWNEVEINGVSVYLWFGEGDGQQPGQVDRAFGNYDSTSAAIDGVVVARPFLLPFFGAGNDGNDDPEEGDLAALPATPDIRHSYRVGLHAPGDGAYKNRYDTLTPNAVAKNTMVVSSVDDAVVGGVRNTGETVASLSFFSSIGPADDGRIKPDIMANGDELASAVKTTTSAAGRKSGTSMASPNAAGSATLLQQLYRVRHGGQAMRASLLKALIIHTADDLSTLGPDYRTGWGLMDTRAAADLIETHAGGLGGGELLDDTVASSGTKTFTHTWDGTQPMRVTLCWTDPPGTGTDTPTTDHRTRMLVNDLDLTVTGPTGTVHRPYVMPYVGDWTPATLSAAATTGTNTVDNVEQVYVQTPISGIYTVTVRANGGLSGGSQIYSLVVSGQLGDPGIIVQQPVGATLTDGTSTVSFGTATTAQNTVRTFVVSNPGSADLQLGSMTLNGTNAGDYSIIQPEQTLLKAGKSTTFAVLMRPTAAGTRTAALHVPTNLPGALSSFDVNLTGTATVVTPFTPTYDVMKSFDLDTPAGGYTPRGGLVFQGGTAYGNTYSGGAQSKGVLFSVNTGGTYNFLGSVGSASVGPPAFPIGPFANDGGTLIGISGGGGNNGTGTVYVSSGGTATTFCSFPANHSGGSYGSALVPGGAGYYGTAAFGGTSGFGTIFQVSAGGIYSVVVNFTGTSGANKGSEPCPKLTLAPNGYIYGTTRFGGTNNLGTVFRLDGTTATTLVDFGAISGNTLGVNPTTGLVAASDGNLYGTAGTRLFKVTPGGVATLITTLTYGYATPLIEGPDGALYGVTGTGPYVQRVQLTPYGGPYTGGSVSQYLDFYSSPPVFPPPTSPSPSALALGPDGFLYGTSQTGGTYNDGTAFRVRTNFGTSPEIDVQQPAGTSLVDDRLFLDPFLFPNIAVGQSVTRTFIVENTSLTGTLYLHGLTKSGTAQSDYVISGPAHTSVQPGGATTFTITFTPSVAGRREAFISLRNNDADEGPFDLQLLNEAPEIEVQEPLGTDLVDEKGVIDFGSVALGGSTAKTVTIKNTGIGSLKVTGLTKFGINSGDFTTADPTATIAAGASSTFNVTFTPSAAGLRVVELHIDNSDEDENTFDIIAMGEGFAQPAPAPEIAVEQPVGAGLTSGFSSVNFGNSGVGVPTPLTFTIRNPSSTTALVLGSITVDGANASDFVTGPPGLTTVPPGGSTTFVVTFTRGSAASRSATLHIANNTEDSNPFDVLLVAPQTGAALPDITMTKGSGAGIVDGSVTPVSFGSINVGQTAGQSFTIRNDGLIVLTLGSATVSGANAADFVVTPPEDNVLPPGAATTMRVTFRPAAGGTRAAALHLVSTDPDESPFDINLTGIGVSGPEIAVEQPAGTNLIDGGALSDFGTLNVGQVSSERVFTIRNTGSVNLTGIAVTKAVTGQPADYYVNTVSTSTTLTPGASTTFGVFFQPRSGGVRAATVQIASNDADENPFDIPVTGTATSPAAQMTNPADGSTLTSAAVAFNWSAGTGVTSYSLWIGSTVNGYDLYAGSEGTAQSRTVTLPDDGRALYVTLFSLIGGAYQSNTYTYTAYRAPAPVKAQITSPANGSTLASASLALTWNAGVGVTQYLLYAGTTAGGYDLYAGNEGTNLARTINNIPADKKIHVTLWSLIKGAYLPNYYVFNPLPSVKATLASPADGSTLAGSTLSLTWNAGVGTSKYVVWIGSSPGGYDLGAADAGTTTSRTFTVPQDGGPVYVTLWSVINGAYQSNGYWFTTALPVSGNRPARVTSQANASTLSSTVLNLAWDVGVGATSYALWIGSYADGYDLYAGAEGASLSKNNIVVPGDGRRIFITLHSLIGASYQSNAYYLTCANLADKGAAQITSPTSGGTLANATLPLTWSSAPGTTQYVLWAGDAPSGYNRYAGAEGLNLNKTLTTMPLDGSPVYVTLYSLIRGAYLPSTAWFTASNSGAGSKRARMTSPTNGSTLSSATTNFAWDGGTNVTGCALWLGSSPGSYDLGAAAVSPNSNLNMTLPTDGRKVHVTLHSLIGGVYQSNGWTYTAATQAPGKAAMTTPANGSTFGGATVTFNWSAGTGATRYYLYVGRKPGGYDVYAGDEVTNLSKTITTMPTDRGPVYVTLWSLINGAYLNNEYIYQAALPP